MTETMTGGRAFARQLAREGVRHVFGLPGDQTMHTLDGLYDESSIQFVTTRHEQGTTYLADGYAPREAAPAWRSSCPGWACTTPVRGWPPRSRRRRRSCSSPGRSTATASARVSGCSTRSTTSSTSSARSPRGSDGRSPDRDPRGRARGLRRVQRGRRQPVEIEMPPEAFSEEAEITLLEPAEDVRVPADPDQIAAAARALATAERPLVWAGGGVVLGNATAALTALAEYLQAPVVTTRQGKGAIDDRHPLAAGVGVGEPPDAAAPRRRRRDRRRRHALPRQQGGGGEDGRARRRRPGRDRPPLREPDRGGG